MADNKPELLEQLVKLLQKDKRFVVEGRLNKNIVVEHALKLDSDLLKLLLSRKKIKEHFFVDVAGAVVFDKDKFLRFVDNKQFLPDSYTAFKNKIGLTIGNDYLKDRKEASLVWPYKDCVLEGGQTKEDQKRNEIFSNETLAPDEIDRLLCPKTLTAFKRYDCKGQHNATEIKDTDNLIIKGNNLLALHSLKNRFAGKVKLIYIDPPYNTGNDAFNYNDNFNHSSWLTFIKNRLDISKELLRPDGVIFVHIDYIEQAYLKIILDEVFDRSNFIQIISMKTATPAGFKVVNPGPVNVTEFLLMYAKSKSHIKHKKGFVECKYQSDYKNVIDNIQDKPSKWSIRNINEVVLSELGFKDIKTFNKKHGSKVAKILLKNLCADYAIKNANRVVASYAPHKPAAGLQQAVEKSKERPDRVLLYQREGNSDCYLLNGRLLAFYKNKLKKIDDKVLPTQLLTDFWNDLSWDSLSFEGGVKLKNGKKPEALLRRIIELTTEKHDVVLDFFLGSGTTAAVAHKMDRQYIGIEQLNYGDNDSVIRLQNVIGKKQKAKGKFIDEIDYDTSGVSKAVNWQGGGEFVYCELMQWNEVFVQKIQDAKTKKELAGVWQEIKEKANISYLLDIEAFDENATDFEALTIQQQKQFLLETLDKNLLYVNYSEIDDEDYKVSKKDKDLNQQFYKN